MKNSSKKPVVVYGASGYTGRLVCEYLREYGIPFIAAGRSKDKLDEAMQSHVPGIETASYEKAFSLLAPEDRRSQRAGLIVAGNCASSSLRWATPAPCRTRGRP